MESLVSALALIGGMVVAGVLLIAMMILGEIYSAQKEKR